MGQYDVETWEDPVHQRCCGVGALGTLHAGATFGVVTSSRPPGRVGTLLDWSLGRSFQVVMVERETHREDGFTLPIDAPTSESRTPSLFGVNDRCLLRPMS